MEQSVLGIHHVTALAGDPQRNVEFYTGVLGLRLVKRTVNYDDPATYHFYYGDGPGHPGTLLTFFPWPGGFRGRSGTGQSTEVAFSVPEGSLGYWRDRLRLYGFEGQAAPTRFGEEALLLEDPDGLRLSLVASINDERPPWMGGPVPPERGVRGLYSFTLTEEGYERTAGLMTGTLGFRPAGEHGSTFRFEVGAGGPGATVDVVCRPNELPGAVAVGTVHHVAYRCANDIEQLAWRKELVRLGYNVSPVMDRNYFDSIYFREPGHVLFEIATDPPGMTVDEPLESLGEHLKLPPSLEIARTDIERMLPPITLRPAREQAA